MSLQEARRRGRSALVTGILCALFFGGGDGAGGGDDGLDAARQQVAASDPRGAAPPAVLPIVAPDVVPQGDGVLRVVPATVPPPAGSQVRRYLVEVEGGLGIDPVSFAAAAESTLNDPRSWSAGGRPALQRVDRGPVDFHLVLASPVLTDDLCAPLRTAGRYSCFQDGRAVVNSMRWVTGATAYDDRLDDYRHYVVNHEVGHALGSGHASCPRAGDPAPVMMQQTKGVGACTPSAWPFP